MLISIHTKYVIKINNHLNPNVTKNEEVLQLKQVPEISIIGKGSQIVVQTKSKKEAISLIVKQPQ